MGRDDNTKDATSEVDEIPTRRQARASKLAKAEKAAASAPASAPTHAAIYSAAAFIGCDIRLARATLIHGPERPRGKVHKERARLLFAKLAESESAK